MSVDRLADGYEPRFDLDATIGRQGELFVHDIAEGIASGTVEVKTDEMTRRTGNVYVETECRYNGEWRDSGIRTTSAELWAIVIGERRVMVALPVGVVRDMAERSIVLGGMKTCGRGSHPTRGAVVPLLKLLPWAMTLLGEQT